MAEHKNEAAWIEEAQARFTVKEAPYPTSPGDHQIVLHVGAVAMNPMDYKLQDGGGSRPLQYPNILGTDSAGTIVAVGSAVQDFRVGDRVIAYTHGCLIGKPAQGAFQRYVLADDHDLVAIPEHTSFADASVLPMGCYTAMAGLYVDEFLGLPLPTLSPLSKGEVILVWGGSSSVGCCAIQMARASGYEVLALASSRNHALCKEIGATLTIDYSQSDLVDAVVAALADRTLAGALDCIGDVEKTIRPCSRIVARCGGSKKLMSVLAPPETGVAEGVHAQRVLVPKLQGTTITVAVRKWMTDALKSKQLLPRPSPNVVGHGLEHVQDAIDAMRKGVSATKLVVTL